MLRPVIASLPRVCHRCTCPLPAHAHICPNCFVPQGDITLEGLLNNALMVILVVALFGFMGWVVYQFMLIV